MSNVIHDQSNHRFLVKLENEEEAVLKYSILDDSTLDFYSTYVPEAGRGKGLAALLTESGLEYARKNSLKIRPTCSYVERYFDKNPEHSEIRESSSME